MVGLLTLLLPANWLRPISVVVRILLAVVLMVEFFSNFFLQLFSGHLPAYASTYLRWLPSFWFVGVDESILRYRYTAHARYGIKGMVSSGRRCGRHDS